MARNPVNTDRQVTLLKPEKREYRVPVKNLPGMSVKVTPSGGKIFYVVARDPNSKKQVWSKIGDAAHMSLSDARTDARKAINRIKEGLAPRVLPPPPPISFKKVAENFVKRHVEAKGLRSLKEIERTLRVYIYPRWENRPFNEIRRSDVAKLLDEVEDGSGPRQADHCLQLIRKLSNWYAARDDSYAVPIVPGMARYDAKARARTRTLSDDEIRLFWATSMEHGVFGALVRMALLTAQRGTKLASMKWVDLDKDIWTIPSSDREKGTGGALVLPPMALEIITSQNEVEGNPYVFTGRMDGHFNGFSPCKRRFDKALQEEENIEPWVFHDLRRTARSLMARAGVKRDIAERVLGHVIPGVEGVYDRHAYTVEKADALKRLSGTIELILSPPQNNVVEIGTGPK